jgi:hypothetical protein
MGPELLCTIRSGIRKMFLQPASTQVAMATRDDADLSKTSLAVKPFQARRTARDICRAAWRWPQGL